VLNGFAVFLTILAIVLTFGVDTPVNESLDAPLTTLPNATVTKVPVPVNPVHRRLDGGAWPPASIHGHGSRRLSEAGEPLVLCPFAYRGSPGPKMVGGWDPDQP